MRFLQKILLVFTFSLLIILFVKGVYASSVVSWTETQPAGDTDQNWTGVKMSRDGTIILAAENNGRLYVSRNAGSSWEEVQPAGDNDNAWLTTGVSSNGQRMIAGAYGGRLFISNDAGKTWTDTKAAGDVDVYWEGGAISGDGNTIIAGINPGRLYISTDAGTSWSETRPAGDTDQNWIPMALSDGGHTIVAGAYGGRLYRSLDQGASWSEIRPAGDDNFNWNTVGMDINGEIMLVGIDSAGTADSPAPGKVYLSKDTGNSWSEQIIAGSYGQEWRISSLSDDGQRMLAGYGNSTTAGRLYFTSNAGSTWTETQPDGDIDRLWNAGAINGDGYTLMVGAGSSLGTRRLYVGSFPRPTPVPGPTSIPANTNTNPCPGFVTCPNIVTGSEATTQVISTGGSNGGSLTINQKPGSMALAVTTNTPNLDSLLSNDSSVPVPWSQGYNIAGDVVAFNAVSAFNGYPVTTLDTPTIIMLHFDPTKIAGHSLNDLRIGWYNPTTKKWQLLNTNTVVKPEENLIANTTTNFGYYTVLFANQNGGYSPVLGAATQAPVKTSTNEVVTDTEEKQNEIKAIPTKAPVTASKRSNKTCFLFVCW